MSKRQALVTGGAGFIGCNAANRLLKDGWEVTLWDNLSRNGGRKNLEWLRQSGTFDFRQFDLRHVQLVQDHFKGKQFDLILHCAGQVAVTASMSDPREDFESNLLGTFNLLETIRMQNAEAFMIYASTNKVYGGMTDVAVVERNGRYEFADLPGGIPESYPVDFHSPYGCSKGGADQYVRDYARIFGLRTVSFRQSCIYGYRQFGLEDQGWVAWFAIAHALGKPVTIYGDGRQVRDLLFIDDLVDAYLAAYENREGIAGDVFNMGGGPENTLSLLELVELLESLRGKKVARTFAEWRPGDQKVFVADTRKAMQRFRWKPGYPVRAGVEKLVKWIDANLDLFRS